MQEIERNKLEAEIFMLRAQAKKAFADAEKAEAERAALKRGWHEWFLEAVKIIGAIALGAGGVTAAITGYQISEVKKERMDLEVAKGKLAIDELNAQRTSALGELAKIQARADALATNLQAARGNSQIPNPRLEAAISSAVDIGRTARAAGRELRQSSERKALTRENYLVGVQTFGMEDAQRVQLNERLQQLGYGLHETSIAIEDNEAPNWFAKEPTVFYYADSALGAAKELAGSLNEVTGVKFAVQKGAGMGVDPAQRNLTLFVHYSKQ